MKTELVEQNLGSDWQLGKRFFKYQNIQKFVKKFEVQWDLRFSCNKADTLFQNSLILLVDHTPKININHTLLMQYFPVMLPKYCTNLYVKFFLSRSNESLSRSYKFKSYSRIAVINVIRASS